MSHALLAVEHLAFHASLLAPPEPTLAINAKGVPSNADKGQRISVAYATHFASALKAEVGERIAGQRLRSN